MNKKYKLSQIVEKFGGVLHGVDIEVSNISPLDDALSNDITFIVEKKHKANLATCKAGAVVVDSECKYLIDTNRHSIIVDDNPYLYYSKLSHLFNQISNLAPGIRSIGTIDDSATVGQNPAIAEFVFIGKNVTIGDNCQIYPHVFIGDNVTIGDNVLIYPNVSIYGNTVIGNNCILHSGSVLASDGFGYAPDKNQHWHKIAQLGGVKIGNDVEIGANTTVDSGALRPTTIGDGVKIDNLVQIAHNVHIGSHSAIASLAGIAGGAKIGKHCRLGGGSGINGHIELCDYTVLGGKSTLIQSTTKPGLYFGLYPASDYKEWARSAFHINDLHDMQLRIKKLEKMLNQKDIGTNESTD